MKTQGKIYIAGKVTGEPIAECLHKFATAAENLTVRGFEIVNPMVLVTDRQTPWQDAMNICLRALETCTALYALPCSVNSKGAQIEIDYALANNFDVYYELENVEADGTAHDLPS